MAAITNRTMTRSEAEEGYRATLPALFHEALKAWDGVKALYKIPSDQEALLEYAGQSDTDAELMFEKFFVKNSAQWTSSKDIYNNLTSLGLKRHEIRRLIKDWHRLYGIKHEIFGTGNQRTRGYKGMAKRGI